MCECVWVTGCFFRAFHAWCKPGASQHLVLRTCLLFLLLLIVIILIFVFVLVLILLVLLQAVGGGRQLLGALSLWSTHG